MAIHIFPAIVFARFGYSCMELLPIPSQIVLLSDLSKKLKKGLDLGYRPSVFVKQMKI